MQGSSMDKLVEETRKKALSLLNETENCAYSPFIALSEALGLELTEDAKAMPIGFAGGISGSRHICGALWAAVAAVSAYTSRNKGEGKTFAEIYMETHIKSAKVFRRFVREFGSPNCGDLNPEFEWATEEQRRKCSRIVAKAVEIALKTVYE